jgi:transposase InsO family protein
MNQKFQRHYTDPSLSGSYSGLESFYRALKKRGLSVKKKELKEWLLSQKTYTLHRNKVNKFQRNRVIVSGLDDTWQADLVDMQKLSKQNNGYKYLLTCIDVFSKYAWIVPLENKFGKTLVAAFKTILKQGRRPKNLQTDDGKEFFNKDLKQLLKEFEINLYATRSEMKACVVERFNRTIKDKMYRFFTETNNYKYIKVIDKLVDAYNSSYHRTIKMAPKEVNKNNEKELWHHMYAPDENEVIRFKLEIGDKVRISKVKNIFGKGYTPNWTEEIFIITEKIAKTPPVYKIKDLNNQSIEGVFYENQLQKIIHTDEEVYRIDHVIKTKIEKGIKYAFVRWLGYSKDFDSWIKFSEIQNIQKQ